MLAWPIRFQDANFRRQLSCCWSSEEGYYRSWVPYGMPRLNPVFKRSVFFLFGIHPKTGKRVGPHGTGVLIGVPPDDSSVGWYLAHFYAITCQHVAPRGSSIIRINTNNGKSRFIKLDPDEWEWIPGHDDLAAIDVTDRIDRDNDSWSVLPSSLLLTRNFIQKNELEIGEDGFMLGLFAEVPGVHRNLIASRFGNVSLLAADDVLIEQPNNSKRPSHIFDMRSRPGFSGSPVFIYRTPGGDLREIAYGPPSRLYPFGFGQIATTTTFMKEWEEYKAAQKDKQNMFLRLLGIHAGQYHDVVRAKKTNSKGEKDDIVRDGDMLRIPNSMAIVVPSWEIETLLRLPTFKEQRRQRENMMKKKKEKENPAEPESVTSDDENGPLASTIISTAGLASTSGPGLCEK